MKMKKFKLSLLCAMLVGTLTGCNNSNSNIKVSVIGDSIVEVPVVTSIDYEKGLKNDKKNFGKFGCSAIGKVLDNGDMVVGRSLDLYYSNNPAYVIKTDVKGYYKTLGLAYMEERGAKVRKKTVQELKDEGKEWLSAYQSVANCNKKTLNVTFFEDNALTYTFKLD